MKNYIGISRDHSGSMISVSRKALEDYNDLIDNIKKETVRSGIDTVLNVVECGIREISGRTINRFVVNNSSIGAVKRITDYPCTGHNTPLFDSVMMLIDRLESVPDYNADDVSFLLMIVTDGGNNAGSVSGNQLATKIRQLQATDKWTITFRVPNGYKKDIVNLGIPEYNVLEFDATSEVEYAKTSVVTASAMSNFYQSRSQGLRSVNTFYADTSNINTNEVRKELSNVTSRVKVIKVAQAEDGMQIRDFVEQKAKMPYALGSAFYQLSKRETLESSKSIIVWDKESGHYYTGTEARSLLNLPTVGSVKIVPGNTPKFEVFIQSSSVNRKLVAGTKVVILKQV
jgi:hypothetical protein